MTKNRNSAIIAIETGIYMNMLNQTIAIEGIFPEKLPMFMAEKKNGIKNTRYITPIDTHVKMSSANSSLPRLKRKKARTTIPAPIRKRMNLKTDDWVFVTLYSVN
jgi:hypothetical protein